MTIALESMAVAMPEVEGHPNRVGFRGVLTVVDAPSERAPSGSKGRRVVLTKAAAEAALPSLLGMAVDYAPSFDRHDSRRKVGVITKAEVIGRNLEVEGFLYAKDFPDIVNAIAKSGGRTLAVQSRGVVASRNLASSSMFGETGSWAEGGRLKRSLAAAVERIRSLAIVMGKEGRIDATSCLVRIDSSTVAAGKLGMSFEVTDVLVADSRMKVWTLMKVTFTGAAILRKDKAAYQDTWIELSS